MNIEELENKVKELQAEITKLKEKESKKEEFYSILADDFLEKIENIIKGRSISFPCGWIYKKDIEEIIKGINWRT